jgi:hypothetical protein
MNLQLQLNQTPCVGYKEFLIGDSVEIVFTIEDKPLSIKLFLTIFRKD